jgi:hypothetical protein
MEYRGKEYSVVQGLNGSWKWYVVLDGHTKSGRLRTGKPGSSLPKQKLTDCCCLRNRKRSD